MRPCAMPPRRKALMVCVIAALAALLGGGLLCAAILVPAPPAVLPIIAVVCVGLPMLAAWSWPGRTPRSAGSPRRCAGAAGSTSGRCASCGARSSGSPRPRTRSTAEAGSSVPDEGRAARGVEHRPQMPTSAARDGVGFVGHATLLIELDGARLLTDPLLRMGIAHVRRRVRCLSSTCCRSTPSWSPTRTPTISTRCRCGGSRATAP